MSEPQEQPSAREEKVEASREEGQPSTTTDAGAAEPSDTGEQLQHDQKTIDELEEKLRVMQEDYLRLRADFDNYRKRMQREMAEVAERAKDELLCELFALSDDIERVLALRDSGGDLESFFTGIELIYGRFCKLFEQEGVSRIVCEGMLDPHLHECVLYEERDDVPEGTILEEVVHGYERRGRVLRPARVKVARRKEE
ncbi:nucleotide exchange factor GrpE [Methermicoccus shengliensis]|uniref:Protein GrpE n=1 Tax=Methermicoccus shengliensis TaxID=660064 RepID=A0A832W0C7_9EURY|nr:nucleotide exchange factor GrpE [Methermicoccus shengliensis]KUK04814.1 MAG: Protein GrpE [Euryarchaeota archaeon 55_53]KUK29572.1 MAG: Protein GrpE [Methanosarcinales archeaon 56_1174]MDI3487731.1 molecular chaperone GrpE [Methanosarcinales archaeon]MDN5295503.1 molecular chaperone GrpE [Methanosarcinales archaeon]HIH70264.1 nucleotide exchange factor GrpE [Methermicoccus shengliensis]